MKGKDHEQIRMALTRAGCGRRTPIPAAAAVPDRQPPPSAKLFTVPGACRNGLPGHPGGGPRKR
jgi:hypothetical protein